MVRIFFPSFKPHNTDCAYCLNNLMLVHHAFVLTLVRFGTYSAWLWSSDPRSAFLLCCPYWLLQRLRLPIKKEIRAVPLEFGGERKLNDLFFLSLMSTSNVSMILGVFWTSGPTWIKHERSPWPLTVCLRLCTASGNVWPYWAYSCDMTLKLHSPFFLKELFQQSL